MSPLPCWAESAVHGPGLLPAFQRLPERGAARGAGEMVSLARAHLHAMLARTDRGLCALRRALLRRLCLFQFLLDELARAQPTLCRVSDAALCAFLGVARRGGGRQRRIFAAVRAAGRDSV